MRSIPTFLIALLLALLTTTTRVADAAEPTAETQVGFEQLKIPNDPDPPLTIGIWYPTTTPATPHALGEITQTVAPTAPIAGDHLPLVVLSHGGAGWYDGHYDTALALAHAGFVTAAVSHAGDTFNDQSKVLQLWRRPAQLHTLIDYMLKTWRGHAQLDANRIGAFGFSNGGFTVLVAAGGTPDLSKVAPFCDAYPDHDLCQAVHQAGVDLHTISYPPTSVWIHDPRIKAIVIAAPSFGFTFGRAGLTDIKVPVELWSAADDHHQPHPFYDEPIRTDLPKPPDFHVVEKAGHYDFLPPCGPSLTKARPEICTSEPGFDRAAFHDQFNAAIVHFFQTTLP